MAAIARRDCQSELWGMKTSSRIETPSVLVVDDDRAVLELLDGILTAEGYPCVTVDDGRNALAELKACKPFLVLLDLYLPGTSGLDVLDRIVDQHPGVMVIMMTATPSIETAVPAIQKGALDYLTKPFAMDEVLLRVRRARERYDLLQENRQLKVKLGHQLGTAKIVGESEAIRQVIDAIHTVAATDINVLIHGESGTGKELVARAIHDCSQRADKAFIPVDCVALTDQLISSELFGHEKGAFTGATERRIGLFEVAAGGTIFLDEITELGMELQAKLLRVLQERQFRRVGGRTLIDTDARIVSATNRDPRQAVEDKVLRLDLYYRLNVIPIRVPPLRERPRDVALFVDHFLYEYAERHHRPMKRVAAGALQTLQHHDWPGNVRELQNLVSRLAIMVPGETIEAKDVRAALGADTGTRESGTDLFALPLKEAKRQWVQQFQRDYIRQLLDRYGGVISRAARAAGVDRKTLARLMAESNIA